MHEKYPELSMRIKSAFIDGLFIFLLMFFFSAVLDRLTEPPVWLNMLMFIGIWVLYEPVCVAFGCTIGNYLMGIRVRRASNEARHINIFQSLVRYALKISLGWLSFLTIHQNTQRRAIHDLAAGSVMVYREK